MLASVVLPVRIQRDISLNDWSQVRSRIPEPGMPETAMSKRFDAAVC